MKSRIAPILARRSVRSFRAEPVSDADIRLLLEAGMAAPSARNLQPWRFVVVTGRERLDRLAEIHPYAKMLREAGACLVVCGDSALSPDFWVQDCSAAAENALIAAALLGLGTVWLGVHPRPERETQLKEYLGVPEGTGILCLIAVGHPTEQPKPRTQYDPAKVHRETWPGD